MSAVPPVEQGSKFKRTAASATSQRVPVSPPVSMPVLLKSQHKMKPTPWIKELLYSGGFDSNVTRKYLISNTNA